MTQAQKEHIAVMQRRNLEHNERVLNMHLKPDPAAISAYDREVLSRSLGTPESISKHTEEMFDMHLISRPPQDK